MRWLLVCLLVGGLGCGALAAEGSAPLLRGSYEAAPSYRITQTPAGDQSSYVVARPKHDWHGPIDRPFFQQFEFEIGGRYWYSSGKLSKTLYDDPRFTGFVNSRLTYSDLKAHAGEIFARADHLSGFFLKGYAGLAALKSGELQDEDFPPAIAPYSSTLSEQRDGDLRYFNIDVGYTLWRGARARIGIFAGFHHLQEDVHAFGCVQSALNPLICVPAIPTSVLAISEHTKWESARLGLVADMHIARRLRLTGEAAWVPYTHISAHDVHWLRLGTGLFDISGPIPESGNGYGYQLEAILSYAVSDRLQLGVGGRYWHMQTDGSTQFEHVIVGWPILPVAQPLDFETTRYGVFAQGSYRFGG
jgi:hypothetical protein